MIKGYCRTNLDGYGLEDWPNEFVAVPRQGEWVEAKSGRRLTVAQITHTKTKNLEPIIEIELTRYNPIIL